MKSHVLRYQVQKIYLMDVQEREMYQNVGICPI